jgi:uncharacterized membrane protein
LPNEVLTLTGHLANLASPAPENARSNLGLAVWAVRDDKDKQPFTAWELTKPAAYDPLTLPDGLPAGAVGLKVPLLDGGSSMPLAVLVHLPNSEASVRLQFLVLEDVGTTLKVGDTFVHTPDYKPFAGEVPGNTESSWSVHATRRPSIGLRSPTPGRTGPLLADPSSALPGQAITLSAAFQNNGTTEPALTAKWDVVRVLRKGSPGTQPGTKEETEKAASPASQSFDPLRRGTSDVARATFTPSKAGLYRVTLTLRSGDTTLAGASTEFPVGLSPSYYSVDFATSGGSAEGWSDQSRPDPNPDTGDGTPAALQFRIVGDRYRWGVTPEQFGENVKYCDRDLATCNFASHVANDQTSIPPSWDVTGLNGTAWGPSNGIALDLVPQGNAFLTLRHELNLEPGDGARLEAIPLKSDLRPAFQCANGQPMPFVLQPDPTSAYDVKVESLPGARFGPVTIPPPGKSLSGESVPVRHNALAGTVGDGRPALGGTSPTLQVTRFALSQSAKSTCLNSDGVQEIRHLVNYTLQPVLHVATLPGYTSSQRQSSVRHGALGWGVAGLSVSSAALDLHPSRHTYAVQGGAAKDFLLTVRNLGEFQDQVRLSLDAANSTLPDPSWVSLASEPVVLAPGETRVVVLRIDAPAGSALRPGIYSAPIVARSSVDPAVVSILDATIEVGALVLPDLSAELTTDEGAEPVFPIDSVQPVHATVFNIGHVLSRPTQAVLESVDAATQAATELGRKDVPALCPKGRPGCALSDAQRTFSLDWSVPSLPGDYALRVRVDPGDQLLESSKDNNVATLSLKAIPRQIADLVVDSIQVHGLGPDGTAQDGDLLTFTANVTNIGIVPSEPSFVQLLVNGTGPTQPLASLGPSRTATVSFSRGVESGNSIVRVTVLPNPGTDGDHNNDEQRIILVVKGHGIVLQGPRSLGIDPGQTADLQLNVSNHGNTVDRVLLQLDPSASGWGLRADPNPVTIAPTQQAAVQVSLQAPPNAAAGATTLRLIASPADNPSKGTSITLVVDVRSRPGAPDVEIAPQTGPPGLLEVPIQLQSRSNVAQHLVIELARPHWGDGPMRVSLPAGENKTFLVPVTVPGNATPGLHSLTVRIGEEGNGTLVDKPFDLVVGPGPAITGVWSTAVHHGASDLGLSLFTLNLRVTNSGNVPVIPEVSLRDLGPGLNATETKPGGILLPGDQRVVSVGLRLDAGMPLASLGRADLWARPANGTGPASRSQTLDLPSLDAAPNLRVARADPTPRTGISAGKPVRVALVVANDGDVEAPPSMLYVSANGLLVQPVQVPEIAAGSSVPINVTLTFARGGTFALSFLANGDGTVEERRDDDNGMAFDLGVAKPALATRLRGAPGLDPTVLAAALLVVAFALRRRSA